MHSHTSLGRGSPAPWRAYVAATVLAAIAGFIFVASAPAAPPPANPAEGAVYVQSNTAPANYLIAFARHHDGTLTFQTRYPTLGVGKPAGNPPLGIPFLDSAGSVTSSHHGRLLFVVNAGDNTVTSFRATGQGLKFGDIVPTFGSRPISSTIHGNILYVLNSDTGDASISGYRVDPDGGMTPIAGSHLPTSQPVGGMPAQIQFDKTGHFLVVTERLAAGGNGLIDTFRVGPGGVAEPAVTHPSADVGPFGVAFTHHDVMIVSNEHFPDVFTPPLLSTVSSYSFRPDGSVALIDTELANAGGACWNVITNDGKYVLVTSPFTANINSFAIGHDGELTPVNGTSVVATAPGATLDEALSHDSKFLYVLDSAGFVSSAIDEYEVNHDGTITKIGSSAPFEGSAAGAAAW